MAREEDLEEAEIVEEGELADELAALLKRDAATSHEKESSRGPLSTATLAEIYLAQGFTKQALRIYQDILEDDPGNNNARRRIAEIEALHVEAFPSMDDQVTAESIIGEAPELFTEFSESLSPVLDSSPETGQDDRAVAILEGWLENIEKRRNGRG